MPVIEILNGGKVVNTILADAEFAEAQHPGAWRFASAQPSTTPTQVIPQEITRAQGKAALIMAGMWDGVLAYVASIEDPVQRSLAEVALHDTLTWQRASPFLTTAAAVLGMASEQLDDLFVTASGIQL